MHHPDFLTVLPAGRLVTRRPPKKKEEGRMETRRAIIIRGRFCREGRKGTDVVSLSNPDGPIKKKQKVRPSDLKAAPRFPRLEEIHRSWAHSYARARFLATVRRKEKGSALIILYENLPEKKKKKGIYSRHGALSTPHTADAREKKRGEKKKKNSPALTRLAPCVERLSPDAMRPWCLKKGKEVCFWLPWIEKTFAAATAAVGKKRAALEKKREKGGGQERVGNPRLQLSHWSER